MSEFEDLVNSNIKAIVSSNSNIKLMPYDVVADEINKGLTSNLNQNNNFKEFSLINVSPDIDLYANSMPQLSKKRARLSSFEQVLSFEPNLNNNMFNNYENWTQINSRKRTLDESEYISNFNNSFHKNAFTNNEDDDILIKKTCSIEIIDNLHNVITNANVIKLNFNFRVKCFIKMTMKFII